MDKELLKWGIEHSDPEKLKSGETGFDPKSIVPFYELGFALTRVL